MKSLQPCAEPGCPELVSRGRCPTHARKFARDLEAKHPEWRETGWRWIYSDRRWKALSRQVLREQPQCARMIDARTRCPRRSTDADHIVPPRDGGAPFDRRNVQGLCHEHHSAKTADEIRRRPRG